MSTATSTITVTVAGKTLTRQRTTTADGFTIKDPTLAAAKTGTLTTRTDADTGTFTMDSGHGFATSDRIDVYWSGGGRYGMTATVTGDSVVLDGGGGDDLPVVDTAITAMKPQLEDFVVEAADLQSLFVGCIGQAWAVFIDDADAVVRAIYVGGSTDAYAFEYEDLTAIEAVNPFSAGDVVSVYLSHGDSSASREVAAVAQVN